MARIYVSSTLNDLEEYRKEVSRALRRLGHEDVAMEYYVAGNERPLDRCLDDVASCDLYVGIFAWRYGYVPQENNPEALSITERGYRKALEEGTQCLIFLLSEEAPWPRTKQDRGAAADRIEGLRQELCRRHVVSFFGNPDELAREVNEAVINWEKASGMPGQRRLTDWDAYRQAVCSKHQWVRLQVISGASKERGIAKIPLTEVFEPQLMVAGVSSTDVPEEVRRYQRSIYSPRRSESADGPPADAEEPETTDERVDSEPDEFPLSANAELVLDVVGREQAQVILGGPGSGKSTILHYAMLRLCEVGVASDELPFHLQGAPIPFLIELRNYVLQKTPDFISYIVQNSKGFYDVTVDAESLVAVLEREGQAVVFFDGLDEVFDPDERHWVIDQFQTFAHRYPQARIIVTSRIAGYDRTALGLADFVHYTLLPFTLGQIRHFAENWYQYYTLEDTERTAQGLVQRIVESARLLDLAGNPLLLTMMAVIYKDRDLPNERWRLYERCAETLLEDWDLGKGIEDEDFKLAVLIRTAQKAEILQRVSMYMLEHGQAARELNAIAYAPLLDIVATYLEEKYQRSRGDAEAVAVDILRHLMERTYVLAGIGERVFGFVHRTFMEYFAACRCQAQFNARKSDFAWLTRDIFGAHWQEGEWEEVLLLLIAMLHGQTTPIRDVVEYLRTECQTAVPFDVAFAARCLGEADDVQDQIHGQGLLVQLAQSIAEYAPQSRKEEARAFVDVALRAFAALAPLVAAPAAVQEAIDSLNRAGTVATRMAAWQMGFALRSRKERLGYALAALNDPEEVVRRAAIAALEREWPGRADIGPALLAVVRNDRQARVRLAALGAMQRSWRYEPAILDAVASRVDEETSYVFTMQLIEYLAVTWRGNPNARDLVIKLAGPKPRARYNYDQASVVRAAGRAFRRGWPGDEHARAFLRDRAVGDPEPEAREAALQAIADGWPHDGRAFAFLQDRAVSDPEPRARAAAFRAILQGWRGDAQALAFFQDRAIRDPDSERRAAALRAIGSEWPNDAQALAFLRDRAVSDPEAQAREAAFEGLIATLLPWGLPFSADASVAHDVRYEAVRTTLDFLRDRALHEPDEANRRVVLRVLRNAILRPALVSIGPAQVRYLVAIIREVATHDPESSIRVIALGVIARLHNKLSPRWGHLEDAETLAVLRGNLAFLREQAAKSEKAVTRSTAIWTIADGWPGDAEELAFVQDRAVNDPDPEIRLAGLHAIGWGWGDDVRAIAFLQARATEESEAENRAAINEMIERISMGERWRYSTRGTLEARIWRARR